LVAFAKLAEEFRDPFFLWQATSLRAMRALLSGQLEAAEGFAAAAFELAQRAESANAMLGYATQLTAIRRTQGRAGELVDLVQQIAAGLPDQPGVQVAIAVLCAESNRLEEARLALERTFAHDLDDHPRDVHWTGLLYYCALALDVVPDVERAQRVYDLLLPWNGRCVVYSIAVAADGAVAHGLGLLARVLGRHEVAARHFAEAIEMNERMGARPALARACYDAAALRLARHGTDDAEGRALLRRAVETFEALGMPAHLERARALASAHAAPAPEGARSRAGVNRFRKAGDFWDLCFGGETVRARDRKGLLYLQVLLREPGREFHVLDLIGVAEGTAADSSRLAAAEGLPVERGGGHEGDLDPQSRSEYRARLRDLAAEVAEAEGRNDLGRLERLRSEEDFIERELARAFGLGGRPTHRREAGERARKAVYNRVKAAVEHIEGIHARLGRHLAASVHTGRTCVYRPEAQTEWETD
jgi:tetratricopeptide (TPR) repeat protein